MKFKNTMSYYYTNVKDRLEKLSIPTDHLFEKVKEGILVKIDSQLCRDDVTVFEENILPMISVLQDERYPFKQNIYDPAKVAQIQELVIHLNILLNVYESERPIPAPKKEVSYDRLPNPSVVIKNGVMSQYQDKVKMPDRLPNI